MIFVGQINYPKVMKFVLPLFHDVINLHKKFGINSMKFNYILNYMPFSLIMLFNS
jgi:hypothetical protein